MELRVERMESVIAPNAFTDFVRGFIDGLLGR
jgi:hypothetical protein